MPDSTSPSYEWLRDSIAAMPAASTGEARDLVWADGAKMLGVSRDDHGRVEIFLVGEPLSPRDNLVAESLVHNVWSTRSGNQLAASRLVMPSTPHLDGFAAFVCAELVENGLEHDRDRAFAMSEPVIAMALRRARISDQTLVGLAGELSVLAALTAAAADPAAIVECWAGSVPSSRDLQLGPVGVEVKTTTGSRSEHHIQGFHQVELGTSVGGVPETHLFLLSVGIRWQTLGSQGRTIPELVEAVLERLRDLDAATAFLDKVKQYGGDASIGYDHTQHAQRTRFRRPFQVVFERLYDLSDERIKLLRSTQLDHSEHVDAASVSFRVRLPARVHGESNPTTGMQRIARRLVDLAEA